MRAFTLVYSAIAFFFGGAAVGLVIHAVVTLWYAVTRFPAHVSEVIESIGILAIALVALEIAQTVMEEEVVRRSQVSAPTRVRRYLSRFLVVVVVALSIKYLVAVVRFLEADPRMLWNASSIGVAAAALLAAWGVFIRLNRARKNSSPRPWRTPSR